MSDPANKYFGTHKEHVLQFHGIRTLQDSAAYLISSLRPDMRVLDIGCGPGSITIDFAKHCPQGQAVGVEPTEAPLEKARQNAAKVGVQNVQFQVGHIHALDFPDATFDIVHAHQVVQYVSDPVAALREMRRVAKPGGFVAVRDWDCSSMTWYPNIEGMSLLRDVRLRHARSLGGEPDAGRRLLSWAIEAGFESSRIKRSSSTWLYSTPDERLWWTATVVQRAKEADYVYSPVEGGEDQRDKVIEAWQAWSEREDGWFSFLHGEILCQV